MFYAGEIGVPRYAFVELSQGNYFPHKPTAKYGLLEFELPQTQTDPT